MKKHLEENWIVYVFLVVIVAIIFSIGNWAYCTIKHWNTPYLEVPMHCHFRNSK